MREGLELEFLLIFERWGLASRKNELGPSAVALLWVSLEVTWGWSWLSVLPHSGKLLWKLKSELLLVHE